MEKCKDRDLLENMLAEMAGEFPALSRVFVAERDLFLAHSLQLAAEGPGAGGGNVVAVVGLLFPAWEYILLQFDNVYCLSGFNMINTDLVQSLSKMLTLQVGIGHVPGMVEHWGKVTTEQVI